MTYRQWLARFATKAGVTAVVIYVIAKPRGIPFR